MSYSDELLPEFEEEMKATRRVLERVPGDQGEWKPHPKSFSLAHLAQLVSWMPGWITNALKETSLNLANAGKYSTEKTETLLAGFEKNVQEARAAIAAAQDEDYGVTWSLKHGDKIFFTLPVGVIVRQNINHLVHHRGQLAAYLRPMGSKVPAIYGVSADEQPAAV